MRKMKEKCEHSSFQVVLANPFQESALVWVGTICLRGLYTRGHFYAGSVDIITSRNGWQLR